MRKFRPLDLSFIAAAGSPERESFRNVAAMINANAGWSQPSNAMLAEYAEMQKSEAAKRKPTFIGGLFDLLSTPVYGVANALDEAIAGHQKSNNDSVLSDMGITATGAFTGLARGLGAGLRGGSAMLDVLPGIDLPDKWQLDPEDKTRFRDVNVRMTAKMSPEEAAKPENWQKVKANVAKEKAELDAVPWLRDLFYPDLAQDDESARKDYLQRMGIIGITEDILGDPLNFLTLGTKSAITGPTTAVKGLEEARRAINVAPDIGTGLKVGTGRTLKGIPKFEAPAVSGAPIPEIAIPKVAAETVPPSVQGPAALGSEAQDAVEAGMRLLSSNYPLWMAWQKLKALPGVTDESLNAIESFLANQGKGLSPRDFMAHGDNATKIRTLFEDAARSGQPQIQAPVTAIPKQADELQGEIAGGVIPKAEEKFKVPERIGTRKAAPEAGYAIQPLAQKKLAVEISRLAESNKPGWIYKAADLLRQHPGVDFVETTRFLDMVNKMGRTKGPNFRHNAGALAQSLGSRIAKDATKVAPAERILNAADPVDVVALGGKIVQAEHKAKLRPQQAQIANEVISQFAPQILGKKMAPGTGEALARAKAAGVNANWSGPQQVRMWNQLTTRFKNLPPKVRYDVSVKVLQHIEDYFMAKGAIPYSAAKISESVEGLRLSRIAMALGPKTLADNPQLVTRILKGDEKAMASLTAEQLQKIEALKASEAMTSAPAVQKGITAGKEMAKSILDKVQSAGRTRDELRNAIKVGQVEAVAAGGGPVAAKVTRDYLNRLILNPGGVQSVLNKNSLKTQGWLADSVKGIGKNPPAKDFLLSVSSAVYRAAELPPPAQLGRLSGAAAKVKEGFGALFNAAYGVKDMRHIFLRGQASALNTASARAKYINSLAKVYDPKDVNLWHEAFRAAQADSITAGRISELQAEISKTMESLFGGTGLKANALADSTVVGRSRLAMDELNANLVKFGLGEYQFTNKRKFKDALGNKRNFSKGADWLKSWEVWDVKKPYEFLHKVQQAVEHTVRQKTMMDEIAVRFGSPNRHGNVKYAIDHPRLKGFFFTEEAARQGKVFLKVLDEVNTPSPKVLQHIDHVISKLKAALTIYIPSHHWTNIIGDTMFNWIGGVNDPRRYDQALKVFSSQKGRYGDIASFQKGIAGPDALKQAIARGVIGTETLTAAGLAPHVAGNSVITTMRNGQKITADMIYAAATREGILPSARVLEEVASETTNILDKFRPLGGRGQAAVHQISEFRDHVPRLAQFIDGIAKSGGTFASAVEHSAANVRKWHPDGLDLTKFERQVMKRVFPFYSWTRKAIPLAIEAAIVASPKVMAYPRLMELFAAANEIEGAGTAGGQFPGDQMFPDWIRERGIGPTSGESGSYRVLNPSTPVLDIMTMIGKPGGTALDMLNPLVKVPAELGQGATLGKQVPIEGSELDYLARQIPGISHAGRVSGYYGTSKSVAESDEQKILNLINILTGAKATQTGIYQKSAQFDLRDYLRQQREAAR